MRRCWKCVDWVCKCGRMTGSPLIGRCMVCQLREEAAAAADQLALATWRARMRARASTGYEG